LLCSDPSIRTL